MSRAKMIELIWLLKAYKEERGEKELKEIIEDCEEMIDRIENG